MALDEDKQLTLTGADFTVIRQIVRGEVDPLKEGMDRFEKRLDGVDKRLDGVDKRLDGVDKRLDGVAGDVKEIRATVERLEDSESIHAETAGLTRRRGQSREAASARADRPKDRGPRP